ncbi:MAG: phosphoribosylanthranilate isomerase [Bacillota bacterium]|nr:MAG: phosphoribosylanthranilate isomerase [Bacillota bacterium]
MVRLWVKICGIRDEEAALAALEAGADAIGFVFAESPRRVDPATTGRIAATLRARAAAAGLPIPALVGVFVNAPVERVLATARAAGLTHVQLHGDEGDTDVQALQASGLSVIKAVGVAPGTPLPPNALSTPADLVLLDRCEPGRRGGTGRTADWVVAAAVAQRRPVILAGGLRPDNVAEAVRAVRPWGVDISSGVERARGVKDPHLIARFVRAARLAWEEVRAGTEADAREPAAETPA